MKHFTISDLGRKGEITIPGSPGSYNPETSAVNSDALQREIKIEGDSCGTVVDLDKISQGSKGYVNFKIENTLALGGDPINLNMGVLADPLTFIGSGGNPADLVRLATDNANCSDELGVGCPKWSAFVRRLLQGKNIIPTRLKIITGNAEQRAESLNVVANDLNTNQCNVIGRNPLSWTTNVGYTQSLLAGLDATHGLTYALLAGIGPIDFELEYAAIEVTTFQDANGDCK